MAVQVERELIDKAWQGSAALDDAIAAFSAALAAHALTEGVPAPTADPLVELIVRSGGLYEIVEPAAQSMPEEVPSPARRAVPKSRIVERLHAAGLLAAARAALDADIYARERWYAPDRPALYFDDAEALALLGAIGADADAIMAQ